MFLYFYNHLYTFSLIRGEITIVFSTLGLLISGVVISKFRPSARTLALWNIIVSVITLTGMLSYIFLGCKANDQSTIIDQPMINNTMTSCMSDCNCEYVKYNPICGVNGKTYVSPCHAGCTDHFLSNGLKFYRNCSCISSLSSIENDVNYDAKPEQCPVDCSGSLFWFIVVTSIIIFAQSSGRTSNSLIGLRCVLPQDRSFSFALAVTFNTLLAYISGPFIYGWIFDQTCLLWGSTCSNKGNCWLYDGEALRYYLNMIAASIFAVGLFLDVGTWYFVKNLKIFNDSDKLNVMNLID